jgi:hypothetical protein
VYYSTYTTSSDTNSLYYLVVSCHIDNRTSYHHGNNPPLTVLLLVILARHHISLYFCATLAIERLTMATCLQFTVLVLIEQTSVPGTIVFGRILWHSIFATPEYDMVIFTTRNLIIGTNVIFMYVYSTLKI